MSWSLNESVDEYVQNSLGVAYKTRITGHTDWVATLEIDLDESDAELTALWVLGSAATMWLYYDLTNAKGRTGAGVVLTTPKTVSGTAMNHVTVTVGGNAALADIS